MPNGMGKLQVQAAAWNRKGLIFLSWMSYEIFIHKDYASCNISTEDALYKYQNLAWTIH